MKKQEVLYLAVTADELELPLVVCDSVRELAKWAGCPTFKIYYKINNKIVDNRWKCRYLKVDLPEDDDEEISLYARACLRKILRIFDFCKMYEISKTHVIMQPVNKGGIIFYGKSNKKEKTDNGIEGASKSEE